MQDIIKILLADESETSPLSLTDIFVYFQDLYRLPTEGRMTLPPSDWLIFVFSRPDWLVTGYCISLPLFHAATNSIINLTPTDWAAAAP